MILDAIDRIQAKYPFVFGLKETTCACPQQIVGFVHVEDGFPPQRFYFRARWGCWSLSIGEVFQTSGQFSNDNLAGSIDDEYLLFKTIERGIHEFARFLERDTHEIQQITTS